MSIESVGADGFNTIVAVNLDGNASDQSGEVPILLDFLLTINIFSSFNTSL